MIFVVFATVAGILLPASSFACNMNVGAYKVHNGEGEVKYMDQSKKALYSEQGVWVSWKYPIAKHWDPVSGRIRQENPGRHIGDRWFHWNQLTDDRPPTGTLSPEKVIERIDAPDLYRKYLRERQRQPYNPDIYFLSAETSPEHGTNLELGVMNGNRPKMPSSYIDAARRQQRIPVSHHVRPEASRPSNQPTFIGGIAPHKAVERKPEKTSDESDWLVRTVTPKLGVSEPPLILEQAGSGFSESSSSQKSPIKLIQLE